MDTKQRSIKNLLKNNFKIPLYQRSYSWKETQILELFQDFYDSYKNNDTEYYLGTIITVTNKRKQYEVIDGQQRLTSLYLLFGSIINNLDENTKFYNNIRYLLFKNIKDIYELKLELPNEYSSWLIEQIIGGESIDDCIDELNCIQLNYYNNYKTLYSKICRLDNEELHNFADFIMNKVIMVHINCSDFENGCKIFQTTNQRGLNLRQVDLLKAHIVQELEMKNLMNKHKNELEFIFIKLDSTLDDSVKDRFLNMLSFSLSIQGDLKKKYKPGYLYKYLYEQLMNKFDNDVALVLKMIDNSLNLWINIFHKFPKNTETLQKIYTYHFLNFKEWFALILCFKNNKNFNGNDFDKFIKKVDKLMIKFAMNENITSSKKKSIMNNIIVNINKNDSYISNHYDITKLEYYIDSFEYRYQKNSKLFQFLLLKFENIINPNLFSENEINTNNLCVKQIFPIEFFEESDKWYFTSIYNLIILPKCIVSKSKLLDRLKTYKKKNNNIFITTNKIITNITEDNNYDNNISILKNRKKIIIECFNKLK